MLGLLLPKVTALLCRRAELAQERHERTALGGCKDGDELLEIGGVLREGRLDQQASLRGEIDETHTPVGGMLLPLDQAARDQPVHCGGDRAGGQEQLAPKHVDRERSFMQQRLQYAKVAGAQAGFGDALECPGLHGPMGLPEHKPGVYARGNLLQVNRPPLKVFYRKLS
jgi:hypothetical protein